MLGMSLSAPDPLWKVERLSLLCCTTGRLGKTETEAVSGKPIPFALQYLDEVKPQDVAKRNERDRGTGIQACRVSNTELNPRRVSFGFLEDPHRSMGTRRAPRSITRRSSIPPRRTLENGH